MREGDGGVGEGRGYGDSRMEIICGSSPAFKERSELEKSSSALREGKGRAVK